MTTKGLNHIWNMPKSHLRPVWDLFKTFLGLADGQQTNILT